MMNPATATCVMWTGGISWSNNMLEIFLSLMTIVFLCTMLYGFIGTPLFPDVAESFLKYPCMLQLESSMELTVGYVYSQVFFASVRSGGSSQVYFMTLGRTSLLSW